MSASAWMPVDEKKQASGWEPVPDPGRDTPSGSTKPGFFAGVGESLGIPRWSSVTSFIGAARRDPLGTAKSAGLGVAHVAEFALKNPLQFAWAMTNVPQMRQAWGKGNYSEAAGILAGTVPQAAAMFFGDEAPLARLAAGAREFKAGLAGKGAEAASAAERAAPAATRFAGGYRSGIEAYRGEAGERLAQKALRAPKPGMLKRAARYAVRAGEQTISQAERESRAKASERLKGYRLALSQARQNHEAALLSYDEALAKAREEHTRKANENLAKWKRKADDALAERRRIESDQNKAVALEATRKSLLGATMDSVSQTFAALKQGFNRRWAALRDKIGAETPVDMSGVAKAIEDARANVLRGFPEDIKAFDQMLAEAPGQLEQASVFRGSPAGTHGATLAETLKRGGGAAALSETFRRQLEALTEAVQPSEFRRTEPGAMTWQGAQDRYTALNDKLYRGADQFTGRAGMAPNVKRALSMVRDALGGAMRKAAEHAGAGEEYDGLRRDYSQFMDDWNDLSPEARGGSPLARLLRAVDPEHAATPIEGKAGERLVSQLARYRKFGANPELASRVLATDAAMDKLPKGRAKLPKIPEEPRTEPFSPPKGLQEPTEAKLEKVPGYRGVKTRQRLREDALKKMANRTGTWAAFRMTVSIEELIRHAVFGNIAEGVLEAAALVGGPAALRAVLTHPAVVRWITEEEKTRGVRVLRPALAQLGRMGAKSAPLRSVEYSASPRTQ